MPTIFQFMLMLIVVMADFPVQNGAMWVDSLGGTVPSDVNFSAVEYWCAITAGTQLFHASQTPIIYNHSKSIFLTPDVVQAVLHASGDVTTQYYLYEFRFIADVPRLLYFWQQNYGSPWGTPRPSYVGVTTAIHQQLIDLVCTTQQWRYNGQDATGWRAPWDQDEILLCPSLGPVIEQVNLTILDRTTTPALRNLYYGANKIITRAGDLDASFKWKAKRTPVELANFITQTYNQPQLPGVRETVYLQNQQQLTQGKLNKTGKLRNMGKYGKKG